MLVLSQGFGPFMVMQRRTRLTRQERRRNEQPFNARLPPIKENQVYPRDFSELRRAD